MCIDRLTMTYLTGGRKLNVAPMAPRKKVTLSMSGGGFLGIYHIGVASCFREMEEHFEVEKIAGASAGAIAAACYLCRCCLGKQIIPILIFSSCCLVLKINLKVKSKNFSNIGKKFRREITFLALSNR